MVGGIVGALAGGFLFDLITGSEPRPELVEAIFIALVLVASTVIGRERQLGQKEQKGG